VGAAVTITGTGLSMSDIVSFNGVQSSAYKVNAAGMKLHVRVPAYATSGVVTVTQPATGQTAELPNSPFKVTRGVYLSLKRIWAGGSVNFAGSALAPGHVYVLFMSEIRHGKRLRPRLVGRVLTDDFGNFQVGVSVPWDLQSGKWLLYVRAGNKVLGTVFFVLGDWPEFHHDPALSGYDTFETALTPLSVSKLKLKAYAGTSSAVDSSPVVADGMVYVGSEDGTVYALDAATLKEVWTFSALGCCPTAGSPITSAPAVADGRLFVHSASILFALDATSGKLLWQRTVGSSTDDNSSPVVGDGMVYVSAMGYLYAFNQVTGGNTWDFPTKLPLSSPAFANGVVYVGGQDGNVYAVNAHTGAQIWSTAIGKIVDSSPAVVTGRLYIGTNAGKLYALNSSTGSVVWSWSSTTATPGGWQSPIRSSPAVYNGLIFVGSDYGCLFAVNASTGKTAWAKLCALGYAIRSSPAVANGVLYAVGGLYLYLSALNPTTGNTLWTKGSWGTNLSSPAVANGMVYIGADNKYVLGFGL
jgi:outer membrane protein assembly factor BamB